jgi:hypothetical protein
VASAAGALVALMVISAGSFPLDMPGTLMLAGLALGLVAGDPRWPVEPTTATPAAAPVRGWPRALAWAGVVLGIGLLLCAAERIERSVKSSRWLESAERAMHRDPGWGGATEAIGVLGLALEAEPIDYRAQLRSAQLLLRVHLLPGAEHAARQAIALEPYTPNAWAALAAVELEAGDPGAARQDATRAITLLHDFPFALKLRMRAAEQQSDLAAALEDRQRLSALAAGGESDATARAARVLLRPDN